MSNGNLLNTLMEEYVIPLCINALVYEDDFFVLCVLNVRKN